MDMPRPGEQHKRLAILAGNWEGEETLHPSPWDPKGGVGIGVYVNKMDLEGFVLVCDYVQTQNGVASYRGHGVIGWDAGQAHYLMHWSDSMSGVGLQLATGEWRDNILRFQDQSEMGHTRYTYTVLSDDAFTFSLDHSRDGQEWACFMEGGYAKK